MISIHFGIIYGWIKTIKNFIMNMQVPKTKFIKLKDGFKNNDVIISLDLLNTQIP